jgi:hypothetical protein
MDERTATIPPTAQDKDYLTGILTGVVDHVIEQSVTLCLRLSPWEV